MKSKRKKSRFQRDSDTHSLHFTFLLNNFPVLKQADRYLISYEHGYLKREPEAFHQIIGSVRSSQPDEFLLIDDGEDNCRRSECQQGYVYLTVFLRSHTKYNIGTI
ncbi:MAG: hypothetical protein FDX30_09070 [Chlorobium sp.]|nr:MAG: hypothetical protein FDX30_09070 [Chlorobium sp.]